MRRLHRGRYRYEIWRATGPRQDDVATVDEVGTFGGPKIADRFANRLTRLTGIQHFSAEYDGSEIN